MMMMVTKHPSTDNEDILDSIIVTTSCCPDCQSKDIVKTNLKPYDETVYIGIVKGVISDYNEGLDEEKDGWFCSQHPQDDKSEKLSNLVKEDKRYASVCNMSDVYEWVIASALTVIQRRSK